MTEPTYQARRPWPRPAAALSVGALAVTLIAGCASSAADDTTITAESPAPAASASTTPSIEEAIAFGAFDSEGKSDLWSVAPDGSGLTQLTDTPDEVDICPDFSPDGTQLALCKNVDGSFEIWTSDVDGGNQRQLTDLGGWATFPDWSPDGSQIAFSWGKDGDSLTDLYLVEVATGKPTELIKEKGAEHQTPSFSPDGSTLLYTSQGQLWTMDLESRETTKLTDDDTVKEQTPEWSPDGTRIAYHAMTGEDDDIWIMNADGTDQRNLTAAAGAAEFGTAFSPDGQHIAFTGTGGPVPDGERYIQVIRTDGSDRRVLVPTPGLLQAVPAWQPQATP